jgi:hypothetical protein
MRTKTNLKISHTVYPDGLRVDYDHCQCDEQTDTFGILIVALNLFFWGVLIYLLF